MKRYQSYKSSGVEWIGEIPKHWDKRKFKFLFREKRSTSNLSLSSGSISFGEVIYKDDEGIPEERKETYQEVLKGEFLINPLNLNFDLKSLRIGLSDIDVVVSPGYIVLILNNDNNKGYFKYILRTFDTQQMKSLGNGVRQTISFNHLSSEELVLPPLKEQIQIVQYLDEKTELIDKLITTKERKITLLKEQRKSIINQVVTKGLNPNVKMKDSGVEWIGEIPEHWCLIKMKHKGDVIIGLSYSPENIVDEGEGTLVMRSSNVQNGKPSFLDNVYVNSKIQDKIRLREGDILICSRNGSRNLIGKNCLITKNEVGLTFGVFMTVYRTQHFKFIYWLLNSPIFESQSGLFLTSTINQLTVSTLQNMVLPFVDDIKEQNEIINYLVLKTKEIDDLVELEQNKIDLLKEYRQSLISEVVTGKIKVTTDE